MFDLLVFIGRFQPLHNEHLRIIEQASQQAHNVLVIVGGAGKARTIRNPFTFEERKGIIASAAPSNVIIKPAFDYTYNDTKWAKEVYTTILETALEIANPGCSKGFYPNGHGDMRIGLIGASKDGTSFYLNMFPQLEFVNVRLEKILSATAIRDVYFDVPNWKDFIIHLVPQTTISFLDNFCKETKQALVQEQSFVSKYKAAWGSAPYTVKHVTVDALVEQSGHVLLVKRRAFPGKGLWALPGGHLNPEEYMLEGALRELREETGLKVPTPVLKGSVVNKQVFDDPFRSTLGRVITQAYHIKLPDSRKLPKVRGADDAEKAVWIPVASLKEDMLFDDHFHIIQYFLGV